MWLVGQIQVQKVTLVVATNQMPAQTCLQKKVVLKKKKNFMAPFYGSSSTASRLQPLQGGSLLFTIQFPEIPGTHFINLRRTKG